MFHYISHQYHLLILKLFSKWPNYKPSNPSRTFPNLTIACILDEFSFDNFKFEANLFQVHKKKWHKQFQKQMPKLFLVESAWNANHKQWQMGAKRFLSENIHCLSEIIQYCQAKNIPAVFWNKEDPAHFETFLPFAKLFDIIFTSDINMIANYQKYLDHNNIFSLSFAAQPKLHNPIRTNLPTKDVCFAGTWYTLHKERSKKLAILLRASEDKNLSIYNRMKGNNQPWCRFPQEFKPYIKTKLTYGRMLTAYRHHRLFLNVNTIVNSPSMLARRVFEVVACGTDLISTKSVALETIFGNRLDIVSDHQSSVSAIENRFPDTYDLKIKRHLNYRYVHQHHTYTQRLQDILNKCQISLPQEQHGVSVVCCTKRPQFIDNVLKNFRCQLYSNKELIIILNSNDFSLAHIKNKLQDNENISVHIMDETISLGECVNFGFNKASGKYLAKFDDDDLYGEHYISDTLLAFHYTNAGVIGKKTYHTYIPSLDKLFIRREGNENQFVKNILPGGTLFFQKTVFEQIKFPHINKHEDTAFLQACVKKKISLYSSDPYNYVMIRYFTDEHNHTWDVSFDYFLSRCTEVSSGLSKEKVLI